jgi:hypothetical protein
VERSAWSDERLDERMTAVDQSFDRIFQELHGLRDDMRGLRADFAALQDRLVQISCGLVGVLIAGLVTLVIALA